MIALEILSGLAMAGPTFGGPWAWFLTIMIWGLPVLMVICAIMDIIESRRYYYYLEKDRNRWDRLW